MKKIAVLVLSLIFLLFITTTALAAGWHQIEGVTPAQHDPDTGKWAAESGGNDALVPHRGLTTSTNACRACHAVHEGNNDSFKLLHDSARAGSTSDGTTGECDFCHAAAGALSDPVKKPYTMTNPWGEHSLGTDTMLNPNYDEAETNPNDPDSWKYLIPEASNDVIAASSIKNEGLSCGSCHTVHNAYSLWGNGTTDLIKSGTLATKILRRDPANNDTYDAEGNLIKGDVLTGIQSVANYGSTKPVEGDDTDAVNGDEVISTFCGDCHNKNVNWDRGITGAGINGEGERPNGNAHVLGDVDRKIDVYGQLKTVSGSTVSSCVSCHTSKLEDTSKFPHQSKGHKLFGEGYYSDDNEFKSDYLNGADGIYGTDDDLYVGNPKRILPGMDTNAVCRGCHGDIGKQITGAY